jgi:hypothetical protein
MSRQVCWLSLTWLHGLLRVHGRQGFFLRKLLFSSGSLGWLGL